MHIAVACGGTGGHVIPGIVTGAELRKRGHHVVLWLSGRNVEGSAVKGWDGPVVAMRSRGLSSRLSLGSAGSALRMLSAALAARKTMRRERPDVLLGMGSYTSVGPALAAWSLGVPVVLHEGNAVPGRAVSALSRIAAQVAVAFPCAGEHIRHAPVVATGFPVRREVLSAGGGRLLGSGFTVLVMGGSLGATGVNQLATSALCLLKQRGEAVQVIHLAGAHDVAWVRQRYQEAGVTHAVFDFFQDMGRAYASADLAVARAGGATCSELALTATPALLVPLPGAPRDHQTQNALALQRAGAADVAAQAELTPERLADYVGSMRGNPEKRASMREALKRVAIPEAAERLAGVVENAAGPPEKRKHARRS